MESTITPQLATNSAESIIKYQFLDFGYWFGTPEQGSLNHWPILVLAAFSTLILILVLLLVAVKFLKNNLTPPQQKFLTKASLVLISFGPVGWLFVLARIFGIVFFSARFWWVIYLAALVATVYWLYRQFKHLPSEQTKYQNYQLKKRYFPKKKKR